MARQKWQEKNREKIKEPEHHVFFATNQEEKGKVVIQFCPTEHMKGDYMTKVTHGQHVKISGVIF